MKKIYSLVFVIYIFSANIWSQSPTFTWAKQIGNATNDRGQAIVIDVLGNVYTTGFYRGTVDFDPGVGVFNMTSAGIEDVFISKLDASGNFVWAKSVGGTMLDYGYSIALDGSSNVYVSGYFNGTADFDPGVGTSNMSSAGLEDIFILKLDVSGNFAWAKRIGAVGQDYAQDITIDTAGNVLTTGWFSNTVDFDPGVGTSNLISTGNFDVFVSKLDVSGNFVWAKKMGSTDNDQGKSIITDVSGNVYTTGSFGVTSVADFDPGIGTYNLTSIGLADIFISKLDASGNFVWAKQIGSTNSDVGLAISMDGLGNVLTTGVFDGVADFDPGVGTFNITPANVGANNIFISKLDVAGAFVWAKTFDGASGSGSANSITTDCNGNIYASGSFNGTLDFDPGAGAFNFTSNSGSSDVFIAKLDALGNYSWAGQIDGTLTEIGYGIAIDGENSLYVAGSFQSSVDFDASAASFNMTSAGSSDIFVTKYCQIPNPPITITGTSLICSGTTNTYSITPICGATSYTWTLPSGWSGTSTTNSINTTASATSGNITVTANNACGSSSPQTLAITVNTIPATPGTISGLTTICSGSSNTYSVTNDPSTTSYSWTLPGGWSGTSTTNSINTTASSTSGNITVTANNTCGSSSTQILAITVNTIPSTPGTISGNTTVCSGSNNTYAVTNDPSATSYTWTLPGGWSGTSTTNSINTTASATSGNITVTANNACGNSSPQTLVITVNTIPATPGTISGTATICSGSSNTYSVTNDPSATSYTWTLPGGWTGTSTTNSINTTASATSGNITVTANNACGNSSPQTLAITINTIPSAPGTISGNTTVCSGSNNTYSVTNDPSATSYTWTLPGGWSGTSTTNSINTTASSTSGNITVTANNTCGSSSLQTLAITVNTVPATPGIISGSASICDGSSNTYSVTNDPTATSYTWILPSGWSGTSTTNSINTTASSTSGNITVTANNTCGSSSLQTLAITVNPLPTVNFNYSGADTVCINHALQTLSGGTPSGGTYSGTGVTGTNFDPNVAGLGTHNITYSFTDGNSCTNTDVITITVIGCAGIEDNNQSSIIVYPNPFMNSITLTGIQGGTEVRLYNALGEILGNWIITESNNTINTENLRAGIYFLNIGTIAKKIIKQ